MEGLFLKRLRLKNFCNYEDHTFDFMRKDGTPYPFICFFGPNGVGKTTLLEAISLLSMNRFGRGMDRIRQSLLKYVHNENYDPSYNRIGAAEDVVSPGEPQMLIEGTYHMDNREYVIQMNEHGWIRNDFVPLPEIESPNLEDYSQSAKSGPWGEEYLRYLQRITHFVSSDSDLSLNKFQLISHYMEPFEKIITEIMRWPTKCLVPPELAGMRAENKMYCTDFVIQKTKKHSGKIINVHFKRMSAGERKIAKSFSDLLNLMFTLANPGDGIGMPFWPRLLLIDNVEMHAYFDRHVRLVDSLKQIFAKHQIFSTTHSGVLIKRFLAGQNDQNSELYVNLDEINA